MYKIIIWHLCTLFVLPTCTLVSFCCHIFDPLCLLPPSFLRMMTTILFVCTYEFVFVCLLLFVLYSTCDWNHTALVLFHLTYFTWHNTLKIHPCCCKWQNFIFLWLRSILLCVCVCVCITSSLSNHLSMDLGCIYVLAIVNKSEMNIGVHTSVWISIFIFFR